MSDAEKSYDLDFRRRSTRVINREKSEEGESSKNVNEFNDEMLSDSDTRDANYESNDTDSKSQGSKGKGI